MATTIVTKNSSTAAAVPTAAQLVQGELAVNVADKRIYTEDSVGGIVELGTNPSAEIVANGGIALPDTGKATFGASDDLQIYHDGTHSVIYDAGVGDLRINAVNLNLRSSASGENYLYATNNGAVQIYYDGAEKLSTTSTGIDVTGTATMDGLTVQGSATTRPTIGNSDVNTSGLTTGLNFEPISNLTNGAKLNVINGLQPTVASAYTAGFEFVTEDHSGGGTFAQTKALTIGASGDISFYEDTGTTAKLFWDASAESLGIGTSSPSEKLELIHNGANRVRFSLSDTGNNLQFWNDNTPTFAAAIGTGNPTSTLSGTDGLKFDIYNGSWSEAMRIDSAGNVGIGTTSPSAKLDVELGVDGVIAEFRGGDADLIQIKGASNTIALDTRNTAALTFEMQGAERMRIDSAGLVTVKGSGAGSVSDHFRIESTDTQAKLAFTTTTGNGAIYQDGKNLVFATNTANSERMRIDSAGHAIIPNGVTLGTAVGVYNAANTLDDYEEGTWTPTITGSTSGSATFTVNQASYTKVGRAVHVSCYIINANVTGLVGTITVGGLPFTANGFAMTKSGYSTLFSFDQQTIEVAGYTENGQAYIRLQKGSSITGITGTDATAAGDGRIMMNFTYQTS